MSNEILKAIQVSIEEYVADKTLGADRVEDILGATAPLSSVYQGEVFGDLLRHKDRHGMNKTDMKKFVNAYNQTDDGFFDGRSFSPMRVVEHLSQDKHFLTTNFDEQLRIYESGVFLRDMTRKTAKIIIDLLGSSASPARVESVLGLLSDLTMCEVPRSKDWVNLANGRWCLESWANLEHSPAYESVVQLPVAYDDKARCPDFDEWLEDVLPSNDDRHLLLQLMGYSMLQDVRFGKIAMLYGPTHTGKSTCLDFLSDFLGRGNVSALSLHSLDNEDNRFARAGLVGKLANVSADLSGKYLAGDSQIKQIASGDPMQVEFKGLQSFAYSPFATLWSSSNQLPVSHDRTDAWYERLVILPFMNQHRGEKANRRLLERLTEPTEMAGILNRVLDALQTLLTDNIFLETSSTRTMLEQYRRENDHVSRFMSELYILREGGWIREDDVWETYTNWCDDEGIKPLSKSKLRVGVSNWGTPRIRKKLDNQRLYVFSGLVNQ